MRRLRTICVIIFVASLALLGVSMMKERSKDTEGPAIEVSAGLIRVSVGDGEEDLLQGLKATDAVDGDVTDKLYVESLSPFDEQMHRTVTYIAFDSHNNVTRAQRELEYTDYTAPRFRIEKPFAFDTDTTANVLIWTTTEDALDGVKSGNVFIRADKEIDISMPGQYKAVLETTNSAGDTASLPVTIEIYEKAEREGLPEIALRENIVYLEQGAAWDARQYLESVTVAGSQYALASADGIAVAAPEAAGATAVAEAAGTTAAPEAAGTAETANQPETTTSDLTMDYTAIKIQDTVNTAAPGNYEVVYTYEDTETGTGTGTARLYVVVTERGK